MTAGDECRTVTRDINAITSAEEDWQVPSERNETETVAGWFQFQFPSFHVLVYFKLRSFWLLSWRTTYSRFTTDDSPCRGPGNRWTWKFPRRFFPPFLISFSWEEPCWTLFTWTESGLNRGWNPPIPYHHHRARDDPQRKAYKALHVEISDELVRDRNQETAENRIHMGKHRELCHATYLPLPLPRSYATIRTWKHLLLITYNLLHFSSVLCLFTTVIMNEKYVFPTWLPSPLLRRPRLLTKTSFFYFVIISHFIAVTRYFIAYVFFLVQSSQKLENAWQHSLQPAETKKIWSFTRGALCFLLPFRASSPTNRRKINSANILSLLDHWYGSLRDAKMIPLNTKDRNPKSNNRGKNQILNSLPLCLSFHAHILSTIQKFRTQLRTTCIRSSKTSDMRGSTGYKWRDAFPIAYNATIDEMVER